MGKILATSELFVAAALWGFGFVAAVWAMERLSPFELTFMRFALASVLVVPFLIPRSTRAAFLANVRLAFWPGVFFAGTLIVQTWGLKYTTATKSGFITTLYVVFVPLLESFLRRQRLPRAIWACVAFSFLGTAMIVNVGFGSLNVGDLLTLGCALFATGQIYIMGLVSPRVRHPFLFNSAQAAWAGLLCLPFGLDAGLWRQMADFGAWSGRAQIGLLALAFGSTVIAFGLQVRAQKRLTPTVSSLLFLLESPFAMVFSIALLGEVLGPLEASGALIIFVSAVAASLLEARLRRGPERAQVS